MKERCWRAGCIIYTDLRSYDNNDNNVYRGDVYEGEMLEGGMYYLYGFAFI